MWDELLATFREIAREQRGSGRWCSPARAASSAAGADLTGGGTGGPSRHQLAQMRHVGDVALALHRLPQPTIAKVRGVAVGAGCNMALGCDLVVASDNARFSEIFARRGLSIDFGGSWLLPRIDRHAPRQGAGASSPTSSTRPRRSGSAWSTVSCRMRSSTSSSTRWAAELAAGPPIALAMTKRMLNNSFQVTMEEALDDEGVAQTVNFGTADTMEAMKAFVEKRDAEVRGSLTGP